MSSKSNWSRDFPYKADYNDHFETPEVAYRDILPLLDSIQPSRDKHCIYDPYFCNGRTKTLLVGMGFGNVKHECRDFYKDIENDQVPKHDTVITNPPYSDQHKEQCIEFALAQLRSKNRPFFALMPNYVAAREYYRKQVETKNGEVEDVIYLIPSKSYDYDHPEGTGHVESPFASIWYCGLGRDRIEQIKKAGLFVENDDAATTTLLWSIEELRQHKAIPTKKRPNPKQRRKKRKQLAAAADPAPPVVAQTSKRKQNSRHRDELGRRTKKRF